jgi:hypothetical protein
MTRRGVLPAAGITAGHFGRADEFAFRASDFMGYTAPWYSARDAGSGLLAGRGFGWLGCYVHSRYLGRISVISADLARRQRPARAAAVSDFPRVAVEASRRFRRQLPGQ